ncbi:MAG: hypothetical protein K0S74_583 [Chlamydiales bacterium]|jgi:hypothetical protein|nr:hypothetical protein [Chlamydiales bacterium]
MVQSMTIQSNQFNLLPKDIQLLIFKETIDFNKKILALLQEFPKNG